MNTLGRRVIPFGLVLSCLLGVAPYLASADSADSPTKRHEDSVGGPRAGRYAEACAQGNAKYAARDFPGAVALYRSAIELDPQNPLGHYLLGEAQLAAGSIAEADAAWSRAVITSSEHDPIMRARILFVVADLKERQGKWDAAKAAWQVYLDWAESYPAAGIFAASAHSRQQVIDAMLKQDKAYEAVRRRIAETKDGGVFTDLSKTPPS